MARFVVGVDTGKRRHRAAVYDTAAGSWAGELAFAVRREGFDRFVAFVGGLAPGPGAALVGVEAAGHYHLTLVEYLRAAGWSVVLLDPYRATQFRRSEGHRAKTDRLDARALARFLAGQPGGSPAGSAPPRTHDKRAAWCKTPREAAPRPRTCSDRRPGRVLPMLGPPKARHVDRPVLASLETLVPPDHFYRHLEAKLDLSFVRALVKDRYAATGRPSIDPVVFFRLQLIMFFEGLRSERKLVETASLHLAHRWYLGYHLDEPLPDHSSLSRIRERLGLPIFRRFFERVVELCQQAGLVWGKELFFDATKVRANADVDSLVPRLGKVVEDHMEELFPSGGAEPVGAVEPLAAPGPEPDHSEAEDDDALAPAATGAATVVVPLPARQGAAPPPGWDLLGQCRLDPHRPWSSSYHRLAGTRVSRTDPDAAPMSTGGGAALGYSDHSVVDGGRARIILAALVTPADVQENQALLDLLGRVRFRWRVRPKRAIADAKYGTVATIRAVEEAGIRAYFPLYIGEAGERTRPYYGSSRFHYDAARDVSHCPQDHVLRRTKADHSKQMWVYQARAAVCQACPVKAACTPGRAGRQVLRSFHTHYLDRVRGYHATAAYQKAMRKRAVWVEPLFGEAKQWHGLRQFRLRRLAKVNMEGLFVAAGQNLKRWLVATGWGRRHAPCGALVAQHAAAVRQPTGRPPCPSR